MLVCTISAPDITRHKLAGLLARILIGFGGGGSNFYVYTFNSPINVADRSGLAPGDWWDPRSYRTLPQELNPFNSNGTFYKEANPIGDSASGIVTGDWGKVARAADNTPLGMTEMYGRGCDPFNKYLGYYGTRAALAGAAAAATAAGSLIIGEMSERTNPTGPKPPGWNDNWEWRHPEGNSESSPRWFDEDGGEWRYHDVDPWHNAPHWDYNPWDEWNSPWRNIPIT